VPRVDVLVVSVGGTSGWRISAAELAASLSRAGARVAAIAIGPLRRVRTFALTDFVEAGAASRACRRGLAEYEPAALIYCSMTAALLWPRPGAIWLDALAAENRPGRHGVWQRPVERRRLGEAPLVMAMSEGALAGADRAALRHDPIVVPTPVDRSGPISGPRDIDVLAYAGNPEKKRLDHILSAWERARRDGESLVVAGVKRVPALAGARAVGRLAPAEYRALLRRARVFVAAPQREDYGIAQLEALADGCILVTTPATGAYPALDLARELDPRLVNDDLVGAMRAALDAPTPGYASRAAERLAPFSRAAVDRTVSETVLPRLLTRLATQ
jgi:Glycosyl transferases group 1